MKNAHMHTDSHTHSWRIHLLYISMNRETSANELQYVSFEGGHASFKYLKTSDFHLQWIYEVWTSALVPGGYGHSSPEYGKPNIKLHQSRLCNFDWKEFILLLFHLYSCKSYHPHIHTHHAKGKTWWILIPYKGIKEQSSRNACCCKNE